MTDIQQWRRMIQPARVRTPAAEIDDSDGFLSPRRGLKPKLSSYFIPNTTSVATKADHSLQEDFFNPLWPSWSESDLCPNPEAEGLIDVVMCRLLADPYNRLDARFNSTLLQIFESYRSIVDQNKQLQVESNQEVARRSALEQAMHLSAQQWNQERTEYKTEVKRLELLLAKGKRGLAEVTLARQDSALRRCKQSDGPNRRSDDTLETIFEFLEKTRRYDEKAWGSQRATMRKKPSSPSLAMRRLSKTLTTGAAGSDIRAEQAFVSAPKTMPNFVGGMAGFDEMPAQQASGKCNEPTVRTASESTTSCSEETFATFSCVGDLLPDEAADVNLIEAAGTDNDFVAIKRIALVLAKRRQVDPETIMPKLLELFDAQSFEEPWRSGSFSSTLDVQIPRTRMPATHLQKHPTLMTKASGFFQKLRPQQNTESATSIGRRFSFDLGDDAATHLGGRGACLQGNTVGGGNERALRKSASFSWLAEATSYRAPATQGELLSGIEQSPSPTTSAPASESKRGTRIPTPVFNSSSLARPRREREDSASSLLTAIKHSDGFSQRSSSLTSSASSPPANKLDFTRMNIAPALAHRLASKNRLLEHTNALRGNTLGGSLARPMGSDLNTNVTTESITHGRSPNSPDKGECRKENTRPIN